jgi:predicted DNA binding CopG/RHH family protein
MRYRASGRQGVPGHGEADDGQGKETLPTVETAMKAKQLPQTDSIQELAEFWDTHDLTDFEDQFEDVAEPVFELTRRITVDLPVNQAQAIDELASAKGVTVTQLVGEWVAEKLQAS